jgi:CheY-like chemotaxis protein
MTTSSSGAALGRPVEILVVEDNPADVRLTREAFKEGKVRNRLSVASDGEAAISALKRAADGLGGTLPDLILLDFNMPKMDGREVLAEIKADERLRCIPVLVLTTSKSQDDVLTAYRLNASCFISKPVDLTEFFDVVRSIDDFWLSVVKLPPAGCEATAGN